MVGEVREASRKRAGNVDDGGRAEGRSVGDLYER